MALIQVSQEIRNWRIFNVDKHQVVAARDLSRNYEDRQSLDASQIMGFICSLLEPVMIPLDRLPLPRASDRARQASPGGGLLKLHDYAISYIFDEVDNARDATALCLTNSHILAVGYRRVEELTLTSYAPWAGDRIIAVRVDYRAQGSNNSVTPGTPNLLRPGGELYEALRVPNLPAGLPQSYHAFNYKSPPSSIFEIQKESPTFNWLRFSGVSFSEFPYDVQWVVCNLTKREYVLAPSLEQLSPSHSQFPIKDKPSATNKLDLVTLLMRCVTDRIRVSPSKCGLWAGDRITITTVEKAEQKFQDWSGWTNVTRSPRVEFPSALGLSD